MTEAANDIVFYGTIEATSSYAITMPVRARRELGLETREPIFVFGSRDSKTMILTAGNYSAPDLLEHLSPKSP